jgi:hypothetical protein
VEEIRALAYKVKALPCGAELHAVCGDACHAADPPCSFACVQCAGDHQRALQAAGCGNEAIVAFCAGTGAPLAQQPQQQQQQQQQQ